MASQTGSRTALTEPIALFKSNRDKKAQGAAACPGMVFIFLFVNLPTLVKTKDEIKVSLLKVKVLDHLCVSPKLKIGSKPKLTLTTMHPVIIVVGILYLLGTWRFISGYSHTNFNRDLVTKISLGLLWLPLLIVSKSYRANFTKALKG